MERSSQTLLYSALQNTFVYLDTVRPSQLPCFPLLFVGYVCTPTVCCPAIRDSHRFWLTTLKPWKTMRALSGLSILHLIELPREALSLKHTDQTLVAPVQVVQAITAINGTH